MRIKHLFIIIVLIALYTDTIIAQGCSDAGFCTINSLKPDEASNADAYNQIKAGFSYGGGDQSTSVIGNYIEYNRKFSERFSVDTKLTAICQSGNGVSSLGLSDIFLNANYSFSETEKIILGTKIPLHKSNKMKDGFSLPMDYQNSLGTLDLILGFSFAVQKFQFVSAWQQPLTQNENEFISESYPVNSELRKFHTTNNFKRSGDILVRFAYPFGLSNTIVFTPSLLPIYHLSNDKYSDISGFEKEIEGSRGLTLNANAYFDYQLNQSNSLQLNFGAPLIVRDARPDGLTRSFIVTLEYQTRF